MSSALTQNKDIKISVYHSFALQWTLKGAELKATQGTTGDIILKSEVYSFKKIADLRFYLELLQSCNKYYFTIHGSKMWSFVLAHIFFVTKERVYVANYPNQLALLSEVHPSFFSDDENVTIHCLINAYPKHPAPTEDDGDLKVEEDQTMVDVDGMFNFTLPRDCYDREVIEFIRTGRIPDFTVDKAIQIIRGTKYYQCNALRFLCAEYLMKNITAQNLNKIVSVAIEFHLPILERACTQKIANGSIKFMAY